MTVNEAVHRLVQNALTDMEHMEFMAKATSNPQTVEALAEDIGRLREAIEVVETAGLNKVQQSSAAASFLEHVRERL